MPKRILDLMQKVFFWTIIVSVMLMALSPLLAYFIDDTENIKLADGFTIEGYDVVLDVQNDNRVFVTENITVEWLTSNRRGIYKFIPLWLEYTGQDNKTIKRRSKVSNLRAVGDPYKVDSIKGKARIKIGDQNKYVDYGQRLYTIKYTYNMGKDPFKNFDEFIFHTYGDYWGTEIKNATLEIRMPKYIGESKISFYLDKYRKNDVTKFVDYYTEGRTIYARFNSEEYRLATADKYFDEIPNLTDGLYDVPYDMGDKLETSLTVHIELPDNYFDSGIGNYGLRSFAISIIIFVITGITIMRWYKYGKDFPKRSHTIEFYPPENYSSAEVGYIYNRQTSKKLTISLVISLAGKGYIKIDDLKDKGNNIQITNLMIEPKLETEFNELIEKRCITVRRLKNSYVELSNDEKIMMKYLFKEEDVKKLTVNINKFLEVKDSLVNNGYIEVLDDNVDSRVKDYKEKKATFEAKQKSYKDDLRKYNEELSKMPKLTSYEDIVYTRLFETEDIIILSQHETFYRAFELVDLELQQKLKDLIFDKKATKKMVSSIFVTIFVAVLSWISFSLIKDISSNFFFLYVMSFACIFINAFFTIFMKRKTEYGEEIVAKVKGFREFLLKVEKEKLEELVEEDPKYYYYILPYTYVLDVSRKWVSKFEKISTPQINMGNFDYNDMKSFNEIYDNVYVPPSPSGGFGDSSSSCGGGCSSCGGGCSSCGGGGSW